MNMVDEEKLHSLIHSTFEVVVVRHAVGCCHGELGLWCRPMVAGGVAVFGASHEFAEVTSQMKWFPWNSESCSGSDSQQNTKKRL